MTEQRYTAVISFNDEVLTMQSRDSSNKLVTYLLNLLDTDYRNCVGELIDNHTGKIVQRFRRAAIE